MCVCVCVCVWGGGGGGFINDKISDASMLAREQCEHPADVYPVYLCCSRGELGCRESTDRFSELIEFRW